MCNPNKSKSSSYDNSPCDGCYLNNLTVYNTRTGKSFKPHCRSYTCVKHGWKHQNRLRDALIKELESWDRIRFWTFSLSSRVAETKEEHSKILSKIWRYFVTELRRNNVLSAYEKEVKYIRISEAHRSGYVHFHACFDRYIHRSKIDALWKRATEVICKSSEHLSTSFVKGIKSVRNAAYYITKYVTKQAHRKIKYSNLYSTCGKIVLFNKIRKEDAYAVYDSARDLWLGLHDPSPLLVDNSKHHHNLYSRNNQLFEIRLGIETNIEKIDPFLNVFTTTQTQQE